MLVDIYYKPHSHILTYYKMRGSNIIKEGNLNIGVKKLNIQNVFYCQAIHNFLMLYKEVSALSIINNWSITVH